MVGILEQHFLLIFFISVTNSYDVCIHNAVKAHQYPLNVTVDNL